MFAANSFLTAPRLLLFLRKDKPESVAYLMNFWRDHRVLSVVPWTHSFEGTWALHVDLTSLSKGGEEAYVPIPWVTVGDKPTVAEAVEIFREVKVTYG